MSDRAKCPQCGILLSSGALEGLCPACLLHQGAQDSGLAGETGGFEPPSLGEVARLFPQLEVLELIGKGGMGAIYKARQKALDRLVALKILPPQNAGGTDFAARFTREARALARLNHPHIVAVYEFGQVDGLHYFMMEYVDGLNLRQLEESGQLPSRAALEIVPQICEALQYAHDQGVVHRDIKPENVLVDRKGRVKIADFGLAKLLGREKVDFRLTGEGQIMGTPHYMAPEQVEHPLEVDHRADIYALGVVFYEMLTGELPLGKFAPPSRKVHVDVRLDEVVLRALEKEPERRYQQAGQVKTAVETIASVPASPAVTAAREAGQASSTASGFWTRFRRRVWPPLVVQRNGQRAINWAALALRLTRVVFVTVYMSVFLGVVLGLTVGVRMAIIASVTQLTVSWVLAGFVMGMRVLRGFATPIHELPILDGPAATVKLEQPPKSPQKKRSMKPYWVGAGVFLATLLITTAVTLVLPEQYMSVTRILVEKAIPDAGGASEAFDPYFIQTEVEKIRSANIAAQVVEELDLPKRWSQRYGVQPGTHVRDIVRLLVQKMVDVRQVPNTSVIEIRGFNEQPQDAADIANAFGNIYHQENPNRTKIIEVAAPSLHPARPNVGANVFLGGLIGGLAGIGVGGLVWLWHRLAPSF